MEFKLRHRLIRLGIGVGKGLFQVIDFTIDAFSLFLDLRQASA